MFVVIVTSPELTQFALARTFSEQAPAPPPAQGEAQATELNVNVVE
jgi:hypothetical protein